MFISAVNCSAWTHMNINNNNVVEKETFYATVANNLNSVSFPKLGF